MRVSLLAYRLLLFVFPAEVRRQFGDDMASMFAMQLAETKRHGHSRVRLWLRTPTPGDADRIESAK